jgi:hypothetical protein
MVGNIVCQEKVGKWGRFELQFRKPTSEPNERIICSVSRANTLAPTSGHLLYVSSHSLLPLLSLPLAKS